MRAGDFDEKMLEANINNFKLGLMQQLEKNESRAQMFVNSFINGSNWADEVTALERMSKLTKSEIVAFANKYLNENNCAVIYKKRGQDRMKENVETCHHTDSNESRCRKPLLERDTRK